MEDRALAAERAEQAVWAGLWKSVDAELKSQLGFALSRYLDADCLMMTHISDWFFNRVIGLGMTAPVTQADLDELISMYHNRRVPIGISLSPQCQTPQLCDWLQKRGFTVANEWVKMVRDTTPPAPVNSALRIELADMEQMALVADILAAGFGLGDTLKPVFGYILGIPGNRVYIAWKGDTPIAAGALTLHEGIGHLNTTATLPDYRGHGAQSAIMARRIRDGIEAGCTGFVTETWVPRDEPNHSYNNMLRHGFELLYKRPNWVLAV